MEQNLNIHELMDWVLSDLKQQKYADYTIGSYRQCYDNLKKFIEGKNVKSYSNALAIDFMRFKFGIIIHDLYDKSSLINMRSSISSLRALKVLSDFTEHGLHQKKRRYGRKPFECPDVFKADYELFKKECYTRNYSPMGEASIFWSLQKFFVFMEKEGLTSSSEIESIHLLKFLSSQKDFSSKHIVSTISGGNY